MFSKLIQWWRGEDLTRLEALRRLIERDGR